MTIKEDASEHIIVCYIDEDIKVLDSRFMNNPALAMEQCRRVISHMAAVAQDSYNKAVGQIIFTSLKVFNEEDITLV